MAVRTFAVRPLHAADAPAVLALAATLQKWFTAEGLAEIERDLASHQGYVAVRDGRLLGFITWNPIDPEVANLSWMGVAEELQHGGIGTALLAALVADLRGRGYRSLEVSTVADTVDYEPYAETRRFYRCRGFVDHRVDKAYFGPKDHPYDRLLLRLELGPATRSTAEA